MGKKIGISEELSEEADKNDFLYVDGGVEREKGHVFGSGKWAQK